MAKADLPDEIRIGRDWPKSLALVAVCVGLVVASYYGIQSEATGYNAERFRRGSYVIFPLFSILSVFAALRLVWPWGAPVRMGPEGFIDLRAGRVVIPWDRISNVVRRGPYVWITMRRGFAKTYRITLTQRLLKTTRKAAGPGHLLVADWCLRRSTHELAEVIEACRQRHAGGSDEVG